MDNLYQRELSLPDRSFFLFGMRGVGKSTWSRTVLPSAPRVDLLDEGLYHELLAAPDLIAEYLDGLPGSDWIVIDEVQRIPALLNEVHRRIEDRGARFALLGSSARKLRATGVNLLAGRALRKEMYPLTVNELGSEFDLEKVLRFGSIPLVWIASDPQAVLKSYVQLYIREEIRAEALVRNLPGFVRFLPVAALLHAETVNASSIARDAGVARTTVNDYLDILEDTLMVKRLPGYEAKLRVRERRHPKLYWSDPGIVRAAKRQYGPTVAEERGALLEGWLLQQIRAYAEIKEVFDDIYYWSPGGQGGRVEVDFLLRRGREFLAMEVKANPRYHSALLKGLRAIVELEGVVRRVLVLPSRRSFRTSDGIDVWTVDRFCRALSTGRLWP